MSGGARDWRSRICESWLTTVARRARFQRVYSLLASGYGCRLGVLKLMGQYPGVASHVINSMYHTVTL